MSAERCPTCGQILPAGVSQARLARKIVGDRERAVAGALARTRTQLRKEFEADIRKARHAGWREGHGEGAHEVHRMQRDLKTTRQQLAAEASRRKDLELTVRKLQHKLRDGSPQRQGVLSQDDVRRALQAECAPDEFVVTPPGRRGADILQTVHDAGRTYGTILWEVKETSDWSDRYATKARQDGQRIGADYVCLVTASFPKQAEGLVLRQGVIVIAPQFAGFLARLLRDALVELGQVRLAAQQRAVKAAAILDYVGSAECKARFAVIGDGIAEMRRIQTKERNYHDEHWRKEEHVLGKIATASSGIHGRLLAIARETPARLAARA
jgi:hypothetical protein